MSTLSKDQMTIKVLRIFVSALAILVAISIILILKLKQDNKLSPGPVAGGRINKEDATTYVQKYTDGIFVFDKTTTSFLLDKKLLDSFSTHPEKDTPTFYRIFFAKNEKGEKTLVITGAYLNSGKIINTHITGGYDIEHVFPIDDDGNVYKIDEHGEIEKVWEAHRFPNNTSKKLPNNINK
jgi:hypothetical protein